MFRINTNKSWYGHYCTGDIVFVIVHSYGKKNFKSFREKWISVKLHKPVNTLSSQKAVEKPKTDKKDDTKQIFMKLSYIKEIDGHIPKEINGFLKKLDCKVHFYFNQRNVQFQASFYLQRAPKYKLHCSSVVYR